MRVSRMGLTRRCIEEIKVRVQIYDVVSPVVSLKRCGKQFRGLSPFQNERTPSFYVLPDKNIFKCFSSGLAGDVIRFVQLHEKLTFPEAAEALAERFQIAPEYENGRVPDAEARSLRKELLDLHEQAAYFFHQAFQATTPAGETIRAYWREKRRFTPELAREFKIGLSPADGGGLGPWLSGKGFGAQALHECGLFYAREGVIESDPRRLRPRFRGRLMIPIRDTQGQIVAFTARVTDLTPADDPTREAKYVNSPETPIFHKSALVFNLDRARAAVDAAGRFTLVEGQLDALRCWSVGLAATVAPQGTSVTEDQLRLLRRYTSRIDCLLDGDQAGQKAALRLLPLALRTELDVRFLVLPKGEDPDSLLSREGLAGHARLVEAAVAPMRFACASLLPSAQPSVQERRDALAQVCEIVAAAPAAVSRDGYLREAALHLGVQEDSARRDFDLLLRRRAQPERPAADPGEVKARLTTVEYDLLWLVLHFGDWLRAVAQIVHADWVDGSSTEGVLLLRILAEVQENNWEGVQHIDHILETDEERNCAYSLLAQEVQEENPQLRLQGAVQFLHKKYLQREIDRIDQQLSHLPVGDLSSRPLRQRRMQLTRARLHPPELPPPAPVA